ncbi:MAG: protein kinase [Micrococcales bacterium]|nr:protein kinase [Micrococcales bacterium]
MSGLTLPVGTELGGYVLRGVVGSGASGTVYRANDADGLEVAFKLLHPSVAADSAARQRLRREVELLQRLKAPCVAQVVDAETQQAEAFVVTELIEGTSLDRQVKKHGPFDLPALAVLAQDLAAAIATIHHAGVVHRDLKPANVMLRDDGSVVLIDFGLAQEDAWSRLTGHGLVAGTPGFVSPELLRGAEVGPESDRWAVAAMLISAATGRPPFGGGGVEAVLSRVLEGDGDLAGLEPNLADLLRRAVQADPAARVSLEDLTGALAAMARGEEVLAPTMVAPAEPVARPNAGSRPSVQNPPSPPSAAEQTALIWDDQPLTEQLDPPSPGRMATYPPGQGAGTGPGLAVPPPELPRPKATPWLCLAVWILAMAVALHQAIAAAVGLTLILWLARTVCVGRESVAARWRRYGPRPSDPARTAASVPWYLLRGLLGLLPTLLVGTAVGLGGYWVFAWLGDTRPSYVAALAVGLGTLVAWRGPSAEPTRLGQRHLTRAVFPAGWTRLFIGLIALAVAVTLAWPVLSEVTG